MTLATRSCVSGRGRRHALHPAVDAGRLEDADDDREAALALHLLQHDDLLVVDLADDDPLQFHLHGHGSLALRSALSRPELASACSRDRAASSEHSSAL